LEEKVEAGTDVSLSSKANSHMGPIRLLFGSWCQESGMLLVFWKRCVGNDLGTSSGDHLGILWGSRSQSDPAGLIFSDAELRWDWSGASGRIRGKWQNQRQETIWSKSREAAKKTRSKEVALEMETYKGEGG
jgi:hypothetical protein